jgi:REP element-mobilizing transposase RayT
MAQTHTLIQIHAIFAVQDKASLIGMEWRKALYKHIVSILRHQRHEALAIGGTDDHVHILFALNTTQTLTELVRRIKKGSTEWVNRHGFTSDKFEWQSGYGAFSHGKSQIPAVAQYIKNQEKYHVKVSFLDEYKNILNKLGIEYDVQHLFHEIE